MELQTRYVTSADGTRIAMSTIGQGRPLVHIHNLWVASMESYWQVPVVRDSYQQLAQRRLLVRFDHRGTGLSDREVDDLSLDARVSDLLAVVDHLGAAVDLFATVNGGPIAIAFAARHPELVRRLVLADAPARSRDIKLTPRVRILWSLIETDWELFVRAVALADVGWDETGLEVGRARLDSTTPETFLAATRASGEYDASDLLPQVRCPALLMHLRGRQIVPLETVRRLTASLPNARLVQYEQNHILIPGSEATVRLIEQFLDEDEPAPPQGLAQTGVTVILFADIADSTALTERLGDGAFRDKARKLDTVLRSLIREGEGSAIEGKLLGDGVLAVFASASAAVGCALRCGAAGEDAGLSLHLGIHAGDIIRESDPDGRDNVYGGAVNIASRIAAASAAGELLVSDTVRSLARTSAGVDFEDRGEHELKGVADPQRLFAVRARKS